MPVSPISPDSPVSPVSPISPARACAFAVVRRVFEHDAYADRAFAAQARDLERRERSLAMSLAYGTVQRRATLDFVAQRLCARPLNTLDPAVLAALRLGLLQILYLDGVADHAAVHQSVELTKRAGGGGASLVNAVLRRAARDGRAALADLSDDTPDAAATMRSVPVWLAKMWWHELGAERARALLAAVNEPAESAVRVNTLVASPQDMLGELPVPARAVAGLPEALVLGEPFDVAGSEAFRRGAIMPQSRASMLPAHALAPRSGDRVLDLCAAPGAKTTQLAALMGDQGDLVAVERHAGRARALTDTLGRMRVGCAKVQTADAVSFTTGRSFDAVLVDPPCSGLGTLQSRPDLRWRTSPKRIAELSGLQTAILRAGAQATAPGGALVYSVCTISRAEGPEVVRSLLCERTDFSAEDLSALMPAAARGPFLQTLPDRDGTDGFFIARLCRRSP
jgi:16S rRNA (cytosine967-C5)-methyltransferase